MVNGNASGGEVDAVVILHPFGDLLGVRGESSTKCSRFWEILRLCRNSPSLEKSLFPFECNWFNCCCWWNVANRVSCRCWNKKKLFMHWLESLIFGLTCWCCWLNRSFNVLLVGLVVKLDIPTKLLLLLYQILNDNLNQIFWKISNVTYDLKDDSSRSCLDWDEASGEEGSPICYL